MAKVTIKGKAKGKAAKGKGNAGKAAKAKSTAKPRADVDAQRKKVAQMVRQGKKMGDIADEIGVTVGRAAYLQMLNEVDAGNVPSIRGSNDEKLAAAIVKARERQDEHSSWGWISARAGLPEVKVKKLAEDAGLKVKGSHVAKERAAARPAKAAKGKAKAKAKKGKNSDPS